MRKFLIDGRFLSSMSTGVDRYAYETLAMLDPLCKELNISILVPANAKEIPQYQNIKVIVSRFSKAWTQVVFAVNALLRGATPVNLCNEVSILAPKGITALHDVCYAEGSDYFPEGTVYFPEEERQWFLKIYQRIITHSLKILTVSEFSKKRIVELLHVEPDRVVVAGNGWQHFRRIQEDDSIFDRYPQIPKGSYYFSMASANKNKNVDWVIANAKQFSDRIYVIGGKGLDQVYDFSKVSNIIYVGFLKDEEMKALMRQCKAFVFPSFYEGFGIPPLEAMSVGACPIVSNTACLPEIFQNCAHYIDPKDASTDLEILLLQPLAAPESVLNQYQWSKTAEKLLVLLKTV